MRTQKTPGMFDVIAMFPEENFLGDTIDCGDAHADACVHFGSP
jgi:hypothetical protein